MKKLLFLICFATLTISVNGQDEDPANSMSVLVNDKEYIAKPHRIRIGNYGYVTGNTISPDKSLRPLPRMSRAERQIIAHLAGLLGWYQP